MERLVLWWSLSGPTPTERNTATSDTSSATSATHSVERSTTPRRTPGTASGTRWGLRQDTWSGSPWKKGAPASASRSLEKKKKSQNCMLLMIWKSIIICASGVGMGRMQFWTYERRGSQRVETSCKSSDGAREALVTKVLASSIEAV